MSGAATVFVDRIVMDAARPVEPLSVCFGPSAGPDWSVSVMVDEVVHPDAHRRQNRAPSFWSAGVGR